MTLRVRLGNNPRFAVVRYNFLFVIGIIKFPTLPASFPIRDDGTKILNDRDIPYDRVKSKTIHVETLDSPPIDSTRMKRYKQKSTVR